MYVSKPNKGTVLSNKIYEKHSGVIIGKLEVNSSWNQQPKINNLLILKKK